MSRFSTLLGRVLAPSRIEWAFVVLLGVLCAILTALQYRWTGQISRAEASRLAAGLTERAEEMCRAFDAILTDSRTQLVPTRDELSDGNRETVHAKRVQKWAATNPRPIFHRLAVAIPRRDGLQLFLVDQKVGALNPAEWPSEWATLQDNLSRIARHAGGPPPIEDSSGVLIEYPVFGGSPGEIEWIIFELDLDYARNVWFPDLVRSYLETDGKNLSDVRIITAGRPSSVIYSSPGETNNTEKPFSIRFNRRGRSLNDRRGPGSSDTHWILEVKPRTSALEAMVSSSRHRNLAVAVLLNALIMVAGLALVHYTRRSRQLAEAQMNFVANVSHELRTPLTVIRGAGHNLLRGIASEPKQIEQYSSLIIEHAEQLTAMVEQVLHFAGAKKSHSAGLSQSVSLTEVLNEAIGAMANETEAANCEVHLELPPALPAITGNSSALRRAFQNLIANAAKHAAEGHWIGITAVVDEDSKSPTIEIQVSDRGPGIPENELDQIFNPFFRGATAQAKQIRGSGLGLSLVKEIVEAHGGNISVAMNNGQGSTFTVRLPVSHA